MTAAVIYAAKSTADEHGSIPTQLADGRTLAEREGMTVVAEYSDEAASAYKGDRGPGLARALAECERLGATLIVQHSDRLARGDGKQARHLVEIALWALKARPDDPLGAGRRRPSATCSTRSSPGERNHEDSARKSEGDAGPGSSAEPNAASRSGRCRSATSAESRTGPRHRRVTEPPWSSASSRSPGPGTRPATSAARSTEEGRDQAREAVEHPGGAEGDREPRLPGRERLPGPDRRRPPGSGRRARQRPTRRPSPRTPADDFVLGGMAVCFDCGAAMRSRRCAARTAHLPLLERDGGPHQLHHEQAGARRRRRARTDRQRRRLHARPRRLAAGAVAGPPPRAGERGAGAGGRPEGPAGDGAPSGAPAGRLRAPAHRRGPTGARDGPRRSRPNGTTNEQRVKDLEAAGRRARGRPGRGRRPRPLRAPAGVRPGPTRPGVVTRRGTSRPALRDRPRGARLRGRRPGGRPQDSGLSNPSG